MCFFFTYLLREPQHTPGAYPRHPQTPKWKEFLHKMLVEHLGYVPGVSWKILGYLEPFDVPCLDWRVEAQKQGTFTGSRYILFSHIFGSLFPYSLICLQVHTDVYSNPTYSCIPRHPNLRTGNVSPVLFLGPNTSSLGICISYKTYSIF